MKIIVAKEAGACYGVDRSLDIVKQAFNSSSNIATLGSLIHNPLVVKDLKDNYNIQKVENLDEAILNHIDTLVIRSHGISIKAQNEAKNLGINLIDATCPHVKKVQQTAEELAIKYGHVIVIGKAGHPEVESVCSYVAANNARYYVCQTSEEIDEVAKQIDNCCGLIGVVSQTTQSAQTFEEIIKQLKDKGFELDIKNTICGATKKRQQAVMDLSKKVDAFVVLGGHNSSNTSHLANLCKQNCPKTFHIESIEELDLTKLKDCETIGLSAGASTPQSQIDNVLEELSSLLTNI